MYAPNVSVFLQETHQEMR